MLILYIYKLSNLVFQIIYLLLLIRILSSWVTPELLSLSAIRVVLSWIPQDIQRFFMRIVYDFTEPILAPFRNIISPYKTGGFDISPIVAFFALSIAQRIVNQIIFMF